MLKLTCQHRCYIPPQVYRSNATNELFSGVHVYGYAGPALQRDKTPRELAVEEVTSQVFSYNRFIKNCIELRELPMGRLSFPEVAFVGHTNSGKSRLISSLLHNPALGKYSRTAGNTSRLGFFSAGDAVMLVDTPGYGKWEYKHTKEFFTSKKTIRGMAQGILKQYISLRKHTNLKRVYLCAHAELGLNSHRDREFIQFLLQEQVPFTVVMTRLDSLVANDATKSTRHHSNGSTSAAGDHVRLTKEVLCEIPDAAQRIFDQLGTDKIPFIEVCARSGFNIDALQKDIVFQCCQEIERDQDVNIQTLRKLSYSPPSAAAEIDAENRHAPENQLQIDLEKMSENQYVQAHKQALRIESAQDPGTKRRRYSLADFAERRAPGAVEAPHGSVVPEIENLGNGGLFFPTFDRKKNNNIEENRRKSLTGLDNSSSSSSSSSSTSALLLSQESTHGLDQVSEKYNNNNNNNVISNSRRYERRPKLASSVLTGTEEEEHALSNRDGLLDSSSSSSSTRTFAPPQSLVQDSVIRNLEKFERSPHRYRKLIEHGWNELMDNDGLLQKDSDELRENKFGKRKRHYRLLQKFVNRSGVKKERSLKLDAHGYMCPFIGQDQDEVSSPSLGVAKKGGRMWGLKQKGFGGNSLSVHTFKNRGRSSSKLRKWAR